MKPSTTWRQSDVTIYVSASSNASSSNIVESPAMSWEGKRIDSHSSKARLRARARQLHLQRGAWRERARASTVLVLTRACVTAAQQQQQCTVGWSYCCCFNNIASAVPPNQRLEGQHYLAHGHPPPDPWKIGVLTQFQTLGSRPIVLAAIQDCATFGKHGLKVKSVTFCQVKALSAEKATNTLGVSGVYGPMFYPSGLDFCTQVTWNFLSNTHDKDDEERGRGRAYKSTADAAAPPSLGGRRVYGAKMGRFGGKR